MNQHVGDEQWTEIKRVWRSKKGKKLTGDQRKRDEKRRGRRRSKEGTEEKRSGVGGELN